jgi:hypothetical protein
MVRDALATGELPEQRNPAAWHRALTEERREARQGRWAVGTLTSLTAVLVAGGAAAGGWAVWLLAVALAAFGVVPFRWLTRRAARADELLARLASENRQVPTMTLIDEQGRPEPPVAGVEVDTLLGFLATARLNRLLTRR